MDLLQKIINTPVGKRPSVVLGILCANGQSVSIQASRSHHCTDTNEGPWHTVELNTYFTRKDGTIRTAEYPWLTIAAASRMLKRRGGAVGWDFTGGFNIDHEFYKD